ncbi:MAG: glycosyltransferase family 2 protein [Alphaproteobacteria bacterium]|nr:glycosyltransferase family 2 protein [Alphaproteobacteria bacterium]
MLVSVVITNYNYERFVGAAIESALAQTWKALEIIVVDDGSTDNSEQVLARYADRVTIIRQANGGQAAANNTGLARSAGQLAFLLDADDILTPNCVERVVTRYREGVSKIQFRLGFIDGDGAAVPGAYPLYPPNFSPEAVRDCVLAFGSYRSAPGTGNVFAREFLEQVLPVPGSLHFAGNAYLSNLAPLYGDVETIDEDLGHYRVHGANGWAQSRVDGAKYSQRVALDLSRRRLFASKAADLGYAVDADRCSIREVEDRMLSLRLAPSRHPIPGDTRLTLIRAGLQSIRATPGLGAAGRAAALAWYLTLAALPIPVLVPLVGRFRNAAGSNGAGWQQWLLRGGGDGRALGRR